MPVCPFMNRLMRCWDVHNLYLDIGKMLLHPWCVVMGESKINTWQMYQAGPSMKLDLLVEIVQHHLATDSAPEIVPRRASVLPPTAFQPSKQQQQHSHHHQPHQNKQMHTSPNKIIMYSYFPSAFWLIKMVRASIYQPHSHISLTTV